MEATKLNLRPLGDRVLVRRSEEEGEKLSAHGIILVQGKEKPTEGEVVAVGTGRTTDAGTKLPMYVKKGDHILFGKYSGSQVKFGNEEFLIMSQDDIMGVVQNDQQ